MTTIVGGVLPHGIVFTSDTRTTDNELNAYWESRVTPKVNKRNNIIYGVAGDANLCDLLTYVWEPPQLKFEDPLLLVHTVIMPSINEILPDSDGSWQMLLGIKGHLFNIMDKSVVHDERYKFSAIGSGAAYAIGHLCDQPLTVTSLVRSVEVAAAFDHATGGRVVTNTLKKYEY